MLCISCYKCTCGNVREGLEEDLIQTLEKSENMTIKHMRLKRVKKISLKLKLILLEPNF